MSKKLHEIKDLRLDDPIPFQLQHSQTYHGERLDQLVDSLDRVGLMSPIIFVLLTMKDYMWSQPNQCYERTGATLYLRRYGKDYPTMRHWSCSTTAT